MSTRAWQQAKRWPGWALLGLVVIALLAVGAVRDGGPRTNDERVDDIAKRLACPICDGESVYESRNDTSDKIRNQIEADVRDGVLSDAEIIASIEQLYPQTRFVPRATGIDALVWVLPVVAFVCAAAGLAVAFRRWRRAADAVPTDADRVLVEAALRGEGDDRSSVGADEP